MAEPSIEEKVEELQALEKQLQSILMQKQTLQVELNQIHTATEEVSSTSDDIYKMVGEVLIKADKQKVLSDLGEKKKISDLRIKSIEKQESSLEESATKLRNEIQKAISQQKR